jgi:hypothetical protein
MTFRDVSVKLTQDLDKKTKQEQGIFFTPKNDREKTLAIVKSYCPNPTHILEPSFGSGEFLEDLYTEYPIAKITGIELNPVLFASSMRPNRYCMDFLEYSGTHDLIVGNPPYVVIPKSKDTEPCQTSRPNLFVQFLYKALTQNLQPGGILAFVLPTSLYNSLYYERMRKWMFEHTTILHMEPLLGGYLDTQQDTFLLVLKNTPSTQKDFFVMLGGNMYISPRYKELQQLIQNSTSLSQLGFYVKTGEIVWNQEKDKLADSGTLLIYSSNFSSGTLVLGCVKHPKKQYIEGCTKPVLTGKSILINRGYGNSKYILKPVCVDLPAYYCENHVNVIRPKTKSAEKKMEDVMKSLQSPKTIHFLDAFVGNGALSKTEIETCLPIWIT